MFSSFLQSYFCDDLLKMIESYAKGSEIISNWEHEYMSAYCSITVSNKSFPKLWDHKSVIATLQEILPHFAFVGSQRTTTISGWETKFQEPQLIKDVQKRISESSLAFHDQIFLQPCNGLCFCHELQIQLKLLEFPAGPPCFTEFIVERRFDGCEETQDCQCLHCYVVI
jgi:hypothetical protein